MFSFLRFLVIVYNPRLGTLTVSLKELLYSAPLRVLSGTRPTLEETVRCS